MSIVVSDAFALGTWPSTIALTGDNFLTIHNDGSLVSDTSAAYNLLGCRVKTLVEGSKAAGHHSVTWEGSDETGRIAASGVHFYSLTAGGQTQT